MEYDIVGIGTALIDFTPIKIEGNKKRIYECNPGGSIANFLTAAARQGSRCAFLGKVGRDVFGGELKKALEENGVDCRGMVMDPQHNTSCSFVSLDENGDRSFVFYRERMADSMLAEEELNYEILRESRLLHVTSFALAGDISYETILEGLRFVREREGAITFDVNWRPFIWNGDLQKGKERVSRVISYADILKVSEEEMEEFTGCGMENAQEGANILMDMGPRIVVLTNGSGGSDFFTRNSRGHADACHVNAIDTTGAGDCCFAVFIHELLRANARVLDATCEQLKRALEFANLAASYCVLHRGGIASMPDRSIFSQKGNIE